MNVPIPVLFTHYGDEWIRGSETVLLDLLRTLDKSKIRPVVWCNGSEMAAAARGAGYPTYRTDFRYFLDYDSPKLNIAHWTGLIRRCRTICAEQGIRILHANSAAPAQWLVPTGWAARVPVLAHLHIDYLRRSRYVFFLHATTLVVGVSRQVIEGLLVDGMTPTRTKVIYNGIDIGRLGRPDRDLRSALKIPRNAFVIATAGSLILRKGHDILIRAFAALPVGSVAPHLLIPSDGPERDALATLADSLGCGARVHLLGYVENVTEIYSAANLFALASRGDAFGLVLAEAGYFGLPAVSTRVGGIPEVVADGKTGLLVPPDDAASLAHALSRLMNDRGLCVLMGGAARERVSATFTVERMARQFEDAYALLSSIPTEQLGVSRLLRNPQPYFKLLFRSAKSNQPRYSPEL